MVELNLVIQLVTLYVNRKFTARKRTALTRTHEEARCACVCCLEGRLQLGGTDGFKVTGWAHVQVPHVTGTCFSNETAKARQTAVIYFIIIKVYIIPSA